MESKWHAVQISPEVLNGDVLFQDISFDAAEHDASYCQEKVSKLHSADKGTALSFSWYSSKSIGISLISKGSWKSFHLQVMFRKKKQKEISYKKKLLKFNSPN